MPNIKSAKKRVLVTEKKTEQNKAIRSEFKSEIKKVQNLIAENKLDEAKTALPHAFEVIDIAASKNVIHTNNAANKKSKLAKRLSDAEKAPKAAPVVEEVKEEVKAEPVAEAAPAKKPAAKKTATKKADAEAAPKKATRKTATKKADAE